MELRWSPQPWPRKCSSPDINVPGSCWDSSWEGAWCEHEAHPGPFVSVPCLKGTDWGWVAETPLIGSKCTLKSDNNWTTNSVFPLEIFGADFTGNRFPFFGIQSTTPTDFSFSKKRNISLMTTKKKLSSCRSSMTGRKNYQITSESCVFMATNPQWFFLFHAGLLITPCNDRQNLWGS